MNDTDRKDRNMDSWVAVRNRYVRIITDLIKYELIQMGIRSETRRGN